MSFSLLPGSDEAALVYNKHISSGHNARTGGKIFQDRHWVVISHYDPVCVADGGATDGVLWHLAVLGSSVLRSRSSTLARE